MRARRLARNFGLFDVRRSDFRTVDLRLLAIIKDAKKMTRNERAKVVSGVALSTILPGDHIEQSASSQKANK